MPILWSVIEAPLTAESLGLSDNAIEFADKRPRHAVLREHSMKCRVAVSRACSASLESPAKRSGSQPGVRFRPLYSRRWASGRFHFVLPAPCRTRPSANHRRWRSGFRGGANAAASRGPVVGHDSVCRLLIPLVPSLLAAPRRTARVLSSTVGLQTADRRTPGNVGVQRRAGNRSSSRVSMRVRRSETFWISPERRVSTASMRSRLARVSLRIHPIPAVTSTNPRAFAAVRMLIDDGSRRLRRRPRAIPAAVAAARRGSAPAASRS